MFNLGGDGAGQPASSWPSSLVAAARRAARTALVPFPPDRKAIDIGDFYADCAKIERDARLAADDRRSQEGLERTLAYYREHGEHYWDGVSVPFLDLSRATSRRCAPSSTPRSRACSTRGRFMLGERGRGVRGRPSPPTAARAHAVGVASGTDAITIALQAVGVEPGDEVITAGEHVRPDGRRHRGRRARCRCSPTSTGDVDARSRAASSGRSRERTRAIVPVHLYGQLRRLCDRARARHGLPIVEDCAQAHGAELRGRRAGSLGDAAAFSFYPTKNLGALGDGGAVVTNDAEVADRARSLRNYGERERYEYGPHGWNSRLDELQAAILLVKLRRLEAWTDAPARELAARYDELVAAASPSRTASATSTTSTSSASQDREAFRAAARATGGSRRSCTTRAPIHQHPAYARLARPGLDESERHAAEVRQPAALPRAERRRGRTRSWRRSRTEPRAARRFVRASSLARAVTPPILWAALKAREGRARPAAERRTVAPERCARAAAASGSTCPRAGRARPAAGTSRRSPASTARSGRRSSRRREGRGRSASTTRCRSVRRCPATTATRSRRCSPSATRSPSPPRARSACRCSTGAAGPATTRCSPARCSPASSSTTTRATCPRSSRSAASCSRRTRSTTTTRRSTGATTSSSPRARSTTTRTGAPRSARLAAATDGYLLVTRVPVALRRPSFVVLQRALRVRLRDRVSRLGAQPRRARRRRAGLELVRELVLPAWLSAEGAPEAPVEHRAFLFRR